MGWFFDPCCMPCVILFNCFKPIFTTIGSLLYRCFGRFLYVIRCCRTAPGQNIEKQSLAKKQDGIERGGNVELGTDGEGEGQNENKIITEDDVAAQINAI